MDVVVLDLDEHADHNANLDEEDHAHEEQLVSSFLVVHFQGIGRLFQVARESETVDVVAHFDRILGSLLVS